MQASSRPHPHPRFALTTERLGPLPLVNHFIRRLGLSELLDRHVPTTDVRCVVPHAVALGVLLRSTVVEREPIYREVETVHGFAGARYGLSQDSSLHLSDDRLGRALNRLFDADRAPALARSNCSPAAQSAASTSTWRSSRSASTALLGEKSPRLRSPLLDQSPVAGLLIRDREHPSTIVNTFPRTPPKCSRSRGIVFTLPWIWRSPSRGNPVHDRVEYAIERELRQAMHREHLTSLPLYPEERRCARPTTEQLLRLFSHTERHVLRRAGRIVETFEPALTPRQRHVLDLLDVPASAFRG